MPKTPIADGLHWDYAIVNAEVKARVDPALVSIIALDSQPPRIVPIGTGFIVQAAGAEALVCTAAHNFERGIRQVQEPRPLHHPTTPPEFLPAPRPLDLSALKVRAAVIVNGQVESPTLNWVVVDETLDLAFFSIAAEHGRKPFQAEFAVTDEVPPICAEVALLGLTHEVFGEAPPHFKMKRTLILRRGRVVEHHERHMLCAARCIETTIPVFPGMSGGPVFVQPDDNKPMRPFGFISHDPDDGTDKMDSHTPGASIVPFIADRVTTLEGGKQEALVTLRKARITPGTLRP